MKKTTTDKILLLIGEIEATGFQNTTRLTVIKKWLEGEGRLHSFAAFMAKKVLSRKRAAKDPQEGALLAQARELFEGVDAFGPKLDKKAAEKLYDRLKAYQNKYRQMQWARVRTIHSMDLLLLEQAIESMLHAGREDLGYKLAADLCASYDPRHGTDLYRTCVKDLQDIVRYMKEREAAERS